MKTLLVGILIASSLSAAPRRARVVIVVRPQASGAQFAGNVIGYGAAALIQAWIDRKQGRGPGSCDSLFEPASVCKAPDMPAPRLAPVVTCPVGCSYLPGQHPGIGDGK
jgi:hypothetical protein